MLEPRFADTFKVHSPGRMHAQNAAERKEFHDRITGPLFLNESRRFSNRQFTQKNEQLKSFRYWTYIGITRIADRCSDQRPQFGRKTRGGSTGQQFRQSYGAKAQDFVRRQYGWFQHTTDDIEPLADTHPLAELFDRVNPEQTWGEFVRETVISLRLTGEFFWWLIPNGFRTDRAPGGLPAQLWVLPASWVTPIYSPTGEFLYWWIVPDNDETRGQKLPFEHVVHGRYRDPSQPQNAYSPQQAASSWVDNVENVELSRASGFSNGVNPDVIVELDPERFQDPEPGLLDKLKRRFMARASDIRANNRAPLIAPPGTKVSKWSHTNREMDFTESANELRDNNLALQGCPAVVAGISSDYTRATADAAFAVFCEVTINPLLSFIAGVMTEKIASLFDPLIMCWFPDCTPSDAEFELKQEESAFRMGAADPDEVRQRHGLEPKGEPAYQSGYLPAGMAPLNEDLQPEPLPADQFEPSDDDDDDPEDEDDDEAGEDDE